MVKAVIFDMYETLVTLFAKQPYFSMEMSADANVPVTEFRKIWDTTEHHRSIGKMTLEEALSYTLRQLGCYSDELFQMMISKRQAAKAEPFEYIHPEILPMLKMLRAEGIKIGLISNCFSEEAELIRASVLWNYFDVPLLSYEQGVCKPDEEIFHRCVKLLEVAPQECLYVGDGGSHELEVAEKLGMQPLQATWYLRDDVIQPCKKLEGFVHLQKPMDIAAFCGISK